MINLLQEKISKLEEIIDILKDQKQAAIDELEEANVRISDLEDSLSDINSYADDIISTINSNN